MPATITRKAIIFDIDGTLVDSVDQHAAAWREAFAHFGYQFPLSDIRYQIGKGGDKLLAEFLSGKQIQKHGKALETFRGEYFQKHFAEGLRAFPKVRELFEAIRSDGLLIGLATSARQAEVDRYKKLLKIEGLTDAITTKDDVEHSKPDPDVLVTVRLKLGDLAPAACLFIGDSPHDAEAAVKDGMPSAAVRCGGFPERDLQEAGARRVFADPEEILELKGWREA